MWDRQNRLNIFKTTTKYVAMFLKKIHAAWIYLNYLWAPKIQSGYLECYNTIISISWFWYHIIRILIWYHHYDLGMIYSWSWDGIIIILIWYHHHLGMISSESTNIYSFHEFFFFGSWYHHQYLEISRWHPDTYIRYVSYIYLIDIFGYIVRSLLFLLKWKCKKSRHFSATATTHLFAFFRKNAKKIR